MQILRRSLAVQVTAVASLSASMLFTAAPAQAAKAPVRTTIAAHLTPATALVKSTAVVSGTVTPKSGTLVLQRLVGKSWKTVTHQKSTPAGTFAFSVRTPKAAATWPLRVIRVATKTTKTGASPTVKLHVVTTGYTIAAIPVQATVTFPDAVRVAGAVAPRARGTVALQRLTGATWITVATAALTSTSTFTVTSSYAPGGERLRVVKAYSSTIAGGTSTPIEVTVQPAAAPPTITTVALPQARVGRLYSVGLTVAGGTGASTWSAAGLPAGLSLSASGTLSGTPTTKGTAALTATVTDAAGRTSSAAFTLTVAPPQGHLVAWGYNIYGQLGNGTGSGVATVVPVSGLDSVVSTLGNASAGYALSAGGTVWAWGANGTGQLGTGTTTPSTTPLQVVGLDTVTAIAAGGGATALALRADGTVWGWGSNTYGQLGDGTAAARLTPVQVSGLTSVVAIAGGGSTSYAVRSDGTVWSWGDNATGQLGRGDLVGSSTPVQVSGLTGVTAVSGGNDFALALRNDGTVWGWGKNGNGQLGDGTTTNRTSPVQAVGVAAIKSLSAGSFTSYAVTSSSSLLAWGHGGSGELGDGSTTVTSPPVAVHNLSAVTSVTAWQNGGFAVLADGTAWSWGDNTFNSLGDNTTTTRTEPVRVVGLTGVLSLGSGCFSSAGYAVVAS